ncbi:MAG: creatininase family protein [Planctomycetes bacterium]|nr:creatininase family protein [Planctomycetota bacterium]
MPDARLANARWPDVKAALESGKPVVAILPCGATEAHGPHLPLGTDVIISEGIVAFTLPKLEERGVTAFVLPSLAYAPAEYAAGFSGTISISMDAAAAVILDIARSLKKQGFRMLALVNSHFDPANVAVLREVAESIPRDVGLPVVFPDFTRRKLAEQLTPEFQSGACHAGQFEGSLVLASRPELVDDDARMQLPDNPTSLVAAFGKGAKTFEEAGGPQAYFGSPQGANSEEGVATYEKMSEVVLASVLAAIA